MHSFIDLCTAQLHTINSPSFSSSQHWKHRQAGRLSFYLSLPLGHTLHSTFCSFMCLLASHTFHKSTPKSSFKTEDLQCGQKSPVSPSATFVVPLLANCDSSWAGAAAASSHTHSLVAHCVPSSTEYPFLWLGFYYFQLPLPLLLAASAKLSAKLHNKDDNDDHGELRRLLSRSQE